MAPIFAKQLSPGEYDLSLAIESVANGRFRGPWATTAYDRKCRYAAFWIDLYLRGGRKDGRCARQVLTRRSQSSRDMGVPRRATANPENDRGAGESNASTCGLEAAVAITATGTPSTFHSWVPGGRLTETRQGRWSTLSEWEPTIEYETSGSIVRSEPCPRHESTAVWRLLRDTP